MKNTFKNALFCLSTIVLLSCGCGEACDVNQQKEAWKKYDTAVLEAAKQSANYTKQDFSSEYSDVVDKAIAQRMTDLSACHCQQERPEMSEADIAASKANLHRMETKLLINVCTSYNSNLRSVTKDGTPQYVTVLGDTRVLHPMYEILSKESFDSLRYETSVPDDSSQTAIRYRNMPVGDVLARYGPFALEDKYRMFYNYDGPEFLTDIERLHNNPANWSRCGLSNAGRASVIDICTKFNLNQSDVIDALNTARVFCGE